MIGRIPLEGIPLALSCSASSRLCADSLDRWAWGPSLKPGGDVRHAVAKIDHRGHREHRGTIPPSARPARNRSSSVLSVSSVVKLPPLGMGSIVQFQSPSPLAFTRLCEVRFGGESLRRKPPLGMGSIVHSLISSPAPVGNLSLISRFVPVLKTRTFRL